VQPLAERHALLFVHVFRPHFVATSERILEGLRRRAPERLEAIELRPLDPEAVRRLVNNLFGDAEIPQRVRARIVERAGGNPFYVEEVVRSLLETGALRREGGDFRATERIHAVEIPGTVEEVVRARIDRLPVGRREVVHVASVVGRSFHVEVLRQILPEKETLAEDVEALCESGFLQPWDRLEGRELAFKHPLLQEVAYDSLLETRREELHGAVGRAVEAVLSPNVPGYYDMLAYHFGKARELERAEEFLFQAGDEAARTAASNEALAFFQEASRLYLELHPGGGDPAKRARLERSVGLALGNRGQLIESEPHLNAALRLLGAPVPESRRGLWLRFARNLAAVLARLYGPERARPPASEVDREVIALMMRRAEAQTYVSPERFLFDRMETLARLDRVDAATVPGSGGIYAGTVGIFTFGGLAPRLSPRFLARAEPLVSPEDVGERLLFEMMRHMHGFFAGDWSEALRIEKPLLEQGVREGQLYWVVSHLGLVVEQDIRRGAFEAAREGIALLGSIWEGFDYDYAKTGYFGYPAIQALEERRFPDVVRAAELYHEEVPEDLLRILALSLRASAELHRGELDAAAAALERAARQVRAARHPPVYHASAYESARLALAVARLEAGRAPGRRERADARRSARAALRRAAKVAYRRPEIFRLEGRRLWRLGRRRAALAWWRRSLAEAEALGTRPERARTAHELALRLDEGRRGARRLDGRDAARFHDEAREAYRALGLAWDAARLAEGTPP